MSKHLFCIGLGFSARKLAENLSHMGWMISGTSRSAEGCAKLETAGYHAFQFDGSRPLPDTVLNGVTHLVTSVAPNAEGDPVLNVMTEMLAERASQFDWVGYLSTTGVYGDANGGWVDETSPLLPATERGQRRVDAENGWRMLHETHGLPVHFFRLAGIYGPGRNQLETVRSGKARRIVKPGQVFSRIHVDDIAGILQASIANPNPGAAYNLCDNEAAPPQDVITYAASLLGVAPPEEVAFGDAVLSPMARSFYAESKRVSNERVKTGLGYSFKYPTYREGLKALLQTVPSA